MYMLIDPLAQALHKVAKPKQVAVITGLDPEGMLS
jgi:hypothetical protein